MLFGCFNALVAATGGEHAAAKVPPTESNKAKEATDMRFFPVDAVAESAFKRMEHFSRKAAGP